MTRATQSQIDAAVAAYIAGEGARSIEASIGVLNQTLYYRLKKLGIKLHRSSTAVLCWWCGDRLADKRKKTCGKKECMREAGIAMHWTDTERRILEEGIRDRMEVKAIAKKLPARSLVAVEWMVRKTKLEMRKLAAAA